MFTMSLNINGTVTLRSFDAKRRQTATTTRIFTSAAFFGHKSFNKPLTISKFVVLGSSMALGDRVCFFGVEDVFEEDDDDEDDEMEEKDVGEPEDAREGGDEQEANEGEDVTTEEQEQRNDAPLVDEETLKHEDELDDVAQDELDIANLSDEYKEWSDLKQETDAIQNNTTSFVNNVDNETKKTEEDLHRMEESLPQAERNRDELQNATRETEEDLQRSLKDLKRDGHAFDDSVHDYEDPEEGIQEEEGVLSRECNNLKEALFDGIAEMKGKVSAIAHDMERSLVDFVGDNFNFETIKDVAGLTGSPQTKEAVGAYNETVKFMDAIAEKDEEGNTRSVENRLSSVTEKGLDKIIDQSTLQDAAKKNLKFLNNDLSSRLSNLYRATVDKFLNLFSSNTEGEENLDDVERYDAAEFQTDEKEDKNRMSGLFGKFYKLGEELSN
eukprot:m.216635 g.216635  ORF g.216635 m.216635 type:complete len:441 (-) comp13808_c3_seq1:249-1571(-)